MRENAESHGFSRGFCGGMNWSESQLADFYAKRGQMRPTGASEAAPAVLRHQKPAKNRLEPVSGPLEATLTLWGHCPSKKSNYRVSQNGGLITDSETKAQMEALTMQAMFQWNAVTGGKPVVHPEMTTTFYVAARRQDEDGMYVTLMDVLQKAGVLVNDNIANFNGRKVHEPCQFVELKDERVEIVIRKA